jgi:arylsulfatase A-like enzyme
MDQWNHGRLAMLGKDHLEYPATLPAELTRARYQTRAVGKMHFQPQRSTHGFEHKVLDEGGRQDEDFVSDYHQWFAQHKEGSYGYRDHRVGWNSWMARPTHLPEHLHPTAWTAAEGIRFIRDRDPIRPFFLWLSFARPHSPYDAPQTYFDLYDRDPQIPMPTEGDWSEKFRRPALATNAMRGDRPEKETRRARAGYYGNITFIDHQIGLLLQEFQRIDPEEWRNTLIIFTSDHGDMLGDHHHWRKGCPFESSAHIPMIVAPPPNWQMPGGQVSDQPVELRDVMPTLLDAAGVAIPPSVDGRSLLDVLSGTDQDWRDCVQGDCNMGNLEGCQYITNGAEKYIWYHHTNEELFFDLASDPEERHDLSAVPKYRERVAFWRKRLADIEEKRGERRGKNGELIPLLDCDPGDPRLSLTPNYYRWKQRGKRRIEENRMTRSEGDTVEMLWTALTLLACSRPGPKRL